jgi:hypothetical protein
MKGFCRRGRIGSTIKFAAGVVVGATLSGVLASAAQLSRHDGAFWNQLANQDKAAYVAGYSDATHTSLGKLDSLKLAAAAFHWKGASKILSQVARELDVSGLGANDLTAYLDSVYANPRYKDFDVAMALQLAAMRGTGTQLARESHPAAPSAPGGKP